MLYVSFSLAQSVSRLKSVFRSVYCNLAHRRVESPEHPYKRRRRGWSKLTALASKICGHGRCRPGLALISRLCGQYIKTGIPQPGAIESTLRHIHIHTSSCERTHSHSHAHTKTQRTAKQNMGTYWSHWHNWHWHWYRICNLTKCSFHWACKRKSYCCVQHN